MALPTLIPRTALFDTPTRIRPAISGDGTRIAYLAPAHGALNVWVGTRGGDDFRPVTDDRGSGIRHVSWAHDDRSLIYLQDRDGDENPHLYAVDLDTARTRDLTPFDRVQARVVALDRRFPDDLLVALNRRTPELHDVYRLHLPTGELALVAENTGVARWLADADLKVRGAVAWTGGGAMSVLVRDDERSDWRERHLVPHEDTTTSRPIGFTADGRSLLMLSSVDANAARLLRLDLPGGGREVLFEDPRYDVVGVATHPHTRQAQLALVQRERSDAEVLDPTIAGDMERIARLGRGDVKILNRDRADRRWLVQLEGDVVPAAYHVYDRQTGHADLLFTLRPELERYTLAPMEPFSFTSRDGLTIHGYVTFPVGCLPRGLPTVVHVHGGPWMRDVWGFRNEIQLLANRGYLCIQVNFRGSTGYGKDFVNAGDREWGRRMHDDLVDAVRWACDRGYADPERVGIWGASYGGYAALVAATFTPDLFRCAVSAAGPSNLSTFVRSIPAYWKPMASHLSARIGDPIRDAQQLWERSPLSRVERIRIPVLIAQGANDPRVRREESEQLVAAMRERGIPHEYLLFPDEGHGLKRARNKLRFYAAAERFLAEHLGGRSEPAGD
jgi:dipeptidyl aminopeptidase/acylaminoacyl peptidase